MVASMTGFGRSITETPSGKLVVEILSVNRKFLDIQITLPKELISFEVDIRKWISEKISRGQVSVRVQLIVDATRVGELLPDLKMIQEMKRAWCDLALAADLDPTAVDLPFLVEQLPKNVGLNVDEAAIAPSLKKTVLKALLAFVKMRAEEGKTLSQDLKKRLVSIQKQVDEIRDIFPGSMSKAQERLQEKVKEMVHLQEDERLFREIVVCVEKMDVTEEIVRLGSHLKQFISLLSSKETSLGRKMEFLIQEMGREINTIGSKGADMQISSYVIEIKSELEKIREQIQNIE